MNKISSVARVDGRIQAGFRLENKVLVESGEASAVGGIDGAAGVGDGDQADVGPGRGQDLRDDSRPYKAGADQGHSKTGDHGEGWRECGRWKACLGRLQCLADFAVAASVQGRCLHRPAGLLLDVETLQTRSARCDGDAGWPQQPCRAAAASAAVCGRLLDPAA